MDTLQAKPSTEDELYLRWQADPQDAVSFRRLYGALQRHARAVVVGVMAQAPLDLIDNIVTKALLKAPGHFAGRSRFSTWFHRLAMNATYDRVRRERQARLRSLDGLSGRDLLKLAVNPSGELEASALLERLRRLTNDDEFRLIVRLSEGATLRELANEWHLKYRALTTKWRRLRLRLLKTLTASTSGR